MHAFRMEWTHLYSHENRVFGFSEGFTSVLYVATALLYSNKSLEMLSISLESRLSPSLYYEIKERVEP